MEHTGFVCKYDARKDIYIAARKREHLKLLPSWFIIISQERFNLKKIFMLDWSTSVLQPFMENSIKRRSCPLSLSRSLSLAISHQDDWSLKSSENLN